MAEILDWVTRYSPPVVVLLMLGGAFLYVAKQIIERSIAAEFSAHSKELELVLERRSAFKDKVLTSRYALVTDLSSRLERLMTNLNRIRHGQEIPDGFQVKNEIVPLTEIYEDLNINRLQLTEDFHALFLDKANLALRTSQMAFLERSAAAKKEPGGADGARWSQIAAEWQRLSDQIRQAVDRHFKLSEITM